VCCTDVTTIDALVFCEAFQSSRRKYRGTSIFKTVSKPLAHLNFLSGVNCYDIGLHPLLEVCIFKFADSNEMNNVQYQHQEGTNGDTISLRETSKNIVTIKYYDYCFTYSNSHVRQECLTITIISKACFICAKLCLTKLNPSPPSY
jgi:hypothetical protein